MWAKRAKELCSPWDLPPASEAAEIPEMEMIDFPGRWVPTLLSVSCSSSSVHFFCKGQSQNLSTFRSAEKSSRHLKNCGTWPHFQHCFKKRELKPCSPPLLSFQLVNHPFLQLFIHKLPALKGIQFQLRCRHSTWAGRTMHPKLTWCLHMLLRWPALAAPIN